MKAFTLALLAVASLYALAHGEQSRAETVVGWLAKGQYFDFPTAFDQDGTLIPTIGGGPTIDLNVDQRAGHGKRSRYWEELKQQADILSMCGDDSVPFLLETLQHEDLFVRLIVAMSLDRMLGVNYISSIGVIYRPGVEERGEEAGSPILDEDVIQREFILKYVKRARKVYPETIKPQ